jgi:hypothetical protein
MRETDNQVVFCDQAIELAFKRMKSLVGLEELRAKDANLAKAWINTALLAALLADADADLTPATAEPGEEDDNDLVVLAKGTSFSP